MCYMLNQHFLCGLKVIVAILKVEASHMWWDITEKCMILKVILCTGGSRMHSRPQLLPPPQRTRHCLNCFRYFLLLTSSSGYLLSICLKVFAGIPVSGSQVPVSSQLPSPDHCGPSHRGLQFVTFFTGRISSN